MKVYSHSVPIWYCIVFDYESNKINRAIISGINSGELLRVDTYGVNWTEIEHYCIALSLYGLMILYLIWIKLRD